MRATAGLQTTLTLGSVNHDGQAFSLGLSLEMCLPRLQQDERLPDQIEACVHQAGLEVQRRLFQVLIEKADQELVLQHRHGKGGAGIQRRGTQPSHSRRSSARSPFSGRGKSSVSPSFLPEKGNPVSCSP